MTQSEVLTETNTSESGLSEDAVRIRQKDGLNELAAKPPKATLQMIKEQIIDPMIMILLGAALFSTLFHEYTEAIIIAMIVVINTIIGIVQEKKAQSSLAALRDMSASMAHVICA
ncbi:cation-transporting P-type ATPase, partial [Lactobacillus helveticus]